MESLKSMSFDELLQTHIGTTFGITIEEVDKDENFKKERDRFNKALEYSDMDTNSKAIVIQFAMHQMTYFFKEGFHRGMEFIDLMHEREAAEND